MEVRSTVDQLAGVGVRGQSLARGVVDSVGAVGSGREVSRLCGLIETTSEAPCLIFELALYLFEVTRRLYKSACMP
jgi:hypothetical protein